MPLFGIIIEFTYFLPLMFFFRGSMTIQNTLCINQNVRSKYIRNILTNRKSNYLLSQENPTKRLRISSPNSLNKRKEREIKPKPASSLTITCGAFRPFSKSVPATKESDTDRELQKFRSFWTTRIGDDEESDSKNRCGQINIEELVAEEIEKRRPKPNNRK